MLVEADKAAFMLYRGGVLSGAGCGTMLDHALLLVGSGTDDATGKAYWRLQNTWGAEWGEKGYVRLERGVDECGVALDATYPLGVKPSG